MATGTVGNIRPSDVSIEDIEIFYTYSPDRTSEPLIVEQIDSSEVLSEVNLEEQLLQGLYNLKLPADKFNQLGIYNIYIKPKELRLRIVDCGVLSSITNVKGLVIDTDQNGDLLSRSNSNDLAGYRIEYFDQNNAKIRNLFRIVTSSNKCIPENNNNTNTSETATRYRFTENSNSNLLFLTITPSNPTSLRPNIDPFFGSPNQEIILTNTFFKPVMMEVEMVEHDFETIAIGVFGNQSKSVKDGIITYYNKNNEIYKQFDVYSTEDPDNNERVELKVERDEIDITKNFEDITSLE